MKKLVFTLSVLAMISCKKEEEKEPLYPKSAYEAAANAENGTTAITAAATTASPANAEEADNAALAQLGKEVFNGKGTCATCHKPDVKLVGPSLQDIAKIYKEKNGNMVTFLKGNGHAIVDPAMYEVMKANFALTKTFSDQELKGLEVYIYSTLK